jgi:hypothetical protein
MLVMAVLGADVDPEPPPTKVVASVDWNDFDFKLYRIEDRHLVIRSPAELLRVRVNPTLRDETIKTVLDLVTTSLGVKKIDWDKQMLVLVAGGRQKAKGYRVEVVGVKKKGALTVSWKLHKPKKGDAGELFPATLALAPRHSGKVTFEQTK